MVQNAKFQISPSPLPEYILYIKIPILAILSIVDRLIVK